MLFQSLNFTGAAHPELLWKQYPPSVNVLFFGLLEEQDHKVSNSDWEVIFRAADHVRSLRCVTI